MKIYVLTMVQEEHPAVMGAYSTSDRALAAMRSHCGEKDLADLEDESPYDEDIEIWRFIYRSSGSLRAGYWIGCFDLDRLP